MRPETKSFLYLLCPRIAKKNAKFRGIFFALLFVTAVGGLLFGVQPVLATTTGPCIQERFTAGGNKQNLTCTSNDVKIAHVTGISNCFQSTDGGNTFTSHDCGSCTEDSKFRFDADFEVDLNATGSVRYDIGLYLSTDGTDARTGTCNEDIITPGNAPVTFINLDNPDNTDPNGDLCGDITGPFNTTNNPQIVHMTITTTCTAGTNSNLLLPNCTSWRQPGSNDKCTSIANAYPGSPSKCNCDDNFTVPQVTVTRPSGAVSKTPEATAICAVVRFDVDVHNTDGSSTVDALCDDRFGDITGGTGDTCTSSNNLGTSCTASTCPDETAALLRNTCDLTSASASLASDGHYTCTFDAQICDCSKIPVNDPQLATVACYDANGTHINTVTATLTGAGGSTYPTSSATVTGATVTFQ